MKKLILVLSILTITFAGSALAQYRPWENNIGIHNGNEDTGYYVQAAQYTQLDLHLAIYNCTSNQIFGFELKLGIEGELALLSPEYPVDAVNTANRSNEFVVGYGSPILNYGHPMELMTFSVIVLDATIPSGLYIEPVFYPTIAGFPAYLANVDTGEVVLMRQTTGIQTDLVFLINQDYIPVDTENTSFGNLKSLYR